jgi:hypothetical protein
MTPLNTYLMSDHGLMISKSVKLLEWHAKELAALSRHCEGAVKNRIDKRLDYALDCLEKELNNGR